MHPLRKYLRQLGPQGRKDFCAAIGLTPNYVARAMSDNKDFGHKTAVLIERLSGGKVRRQDLRRDWAEVWPELIPAALPAQASPVPAPAASPPPAHAPAPVHEPLMVR